MNTVWILAAHLGFIAVLLGILVGYPPIIVPGAILFLGCSAVALTSGPSNRTTDIRRTFDQED